MNILRIGSNFNCQISEIFKYRKNCFNYFCNNCFREYILLVLVVPRKIFDVSFPMESKFLV